MIQKATRLESSNGSTKPGVDSVDRIHRKTKMEISGKEIQSMPNIIR